MKIVLIIYSISVLLGLLGEFFLYCQTMATTKKYYKKINKTPLLLSFASKLKLLILTLIPLYNILLFLGGITFTEEKCISIIEKSKDYVKKEWEFSFFYFCSTLYNNKVLNLTLYSIKVLGFNVKKLTKKIFSKTIDKLRIK